MALRGTVQTNSRLFSFTTPSIATAQGPRLVQVNTVPESCQTLPQLQTCKVVHSGGPLWMSQPLEDRVINDGFLSEP